MGNSKLPEFTTKLINSKSILKNLKDFYNKGNYNIPLAQIVSTNLRYTSAIFIEFFYRYYNINIFYHHSGYGLFIANPNVDYDELISKLNINNIHLYKNPVVFEHSGDVISTYHYLNKSLLKIIELINEIY